MSHHCPGLVQGGKLKSQRSSFGPILHQAHCRPLQTLFLRRKVARSRAGNEPYPALFGNKWFKNLTSLAIGTEFMNTHHVFEMPRKYSPVQRRALEQVSGSLKQQGHEVQLRPSDVFLLATGEMRS